MDLLIAIASIFFIIFGLGVVLIICRNYLPNKNAEKKVQSVQHNITYGTITKIISSKKERKSSEGIEVLHHSKAFVLVMFPNGNNCGIALNPPICTAEFTLGKFLNTSKKRAEKYVGKKITVYMSEDSKLIVSPEINKISFKNHIIDHLEATMRILSIILIFILFGLLAK